MTEAPEDDKGEEEYQQRVRETVEFLKKTALFSRHHPNPVSLIMDPQGEDTDRLRALIPDDRLDDLVFIDPKGSGSTGREDPDAVAAIEDAEVDADAIVAELEGELDVESETTTTDPKPGQRSGTGKTMYFDEINPFEIEPRYPETQSIEDFFPPSETDLVPVRDTELMLHESELDPGAIRGQIIYQPEYKYLDLQQIEKPNHRQSHHMFNPSHVGMTRTINTEWYVWEYLSFLFEMCGHDIPPRVFEEVLSDTDFSIHDPAREGIRKAAEELDLDPDAIMDELEGDQE